MTSAAMGVAERLLALEAAVAELQAMVGGGGEASEDNAEAQGHNAKAEKRNAKTQATNAGVGKNNVSA